MCAVGINVWSTLTNCCIIDVVIRSNHAQVERLAIHFIFDTNALLTKEIGNGNQKFS